MYSFYSDMYSSFCLTIFYSLIISSPIFINTVEFVLLRVLIPTLNVYHQTIDDNINLKLIYYKNNYPQETTLSEEENENSTGLSDHEGNDTDDTSTDNETSGGHTTSDDVSDTSDDNNADDDNSEEGLPVILFPQNNVNSNDSIPVVPVSDVYIPSTPPYHPSTPSPSENETNQDNILDDVLSNLEIKNLVEKVNNLGSNTIFFLDEKLD